MITPTAKKSILLIHPPVAKPCEPPAGIARLSAVLTANDVDCRVLDASLEGLLALLGTPVNAPDTWSRRAVGSVSRHLAALRSPSLYSGTPDRYRRAVSDINRVLYLSGDHHGVHLSLSNYIAADLSPVRSRDLIASSRRFKENPFFPYFEERLTACFSDSAPDIIGFSVNFMSQALCAFAMAGFIRNRFPGTRIVFGGGLITSWMHIPGFSDPFEGIADDLVAGPGERALLSMCGIGDDAVISDTAYDYTGFPVDRYLAPGPILPVSASAGCYWRRCSFCPERSEGAGYRPYPPKAVADAIGARADDMRPALVHFLDNALSPRLMEYLIAHPPGPPWYGFVRITRHLAYPDFVRGLKASGCAMLKLGIESGDPRVLRDLHKGIDLAVVSRALRTLKAEGISVYAYLLFGMPAETHESAVKTMEFVSTHADAVDFLNLAVFNLPAYCPEAGTLDTSDFYEGDLSLYREFRHPSGWNRDQVRRFLAREFRSVPALRAIINNDPPFFTSNHAPFFR